jgi:chromosome partitioning protein
MGVVIGIVSLKGGVGKTATAMFCAACAIEDSKSAVVLDADNEGSATRWQALAQTRQQDLGFEVVRAEQDRLIVQAKALAKKHDFVLIDTPPNSRETLMAAALASSLVIVPVTPSGVDIDRLVGTLGVLENVRASRDDLGMGILLTRFAGRERAAQEVLQAFQEQPIFETRVRDLTKYKNSFGGRPKYLTEYRRVFEEIKEAV